MNIAGRVIGGVLVLVSFAWLATLAGVRPFLGTNQVQSGGATPVSTNRAAQGQRPTAIAPASTAKTQAKPSDTQVQSNPRDAQASSVGQTAPTGTTTPSKTQGTTATGTTATGTATTGATTPIQAGW